MVAGQQSTSTASAPLAPLTLFLCYAGIHNRQQWCVGRVYVCVCLCERVSVGGGAKRCSFVVCSLIALV
jgi:hypothetical protein